MSARLWIDVEDLFEYARSNPRPSGIQRLAFEIYAALEALPNYTEFASFVRHDFRRNSFRNVSWQEIESLFASLTNGAPEPVSPAPAYRASRRWARKLVYRLPPALRLAVVNLLITHRAALKAWGTLYKTAMRGMAHRLAILLRPGISAGRVRWPPEAAQASGDFAARSRPGDIILVLGSPWSHPDYAMLIAAHRRRGLKFALLVYDLIPLRRPEWFDEGLVRLFRAWWDSVFPLCDVLFTISRATAADVQAYARERGMTLPAPPMPIPIGAGFQAQHMRPRPPPKRPLPPPGAYALIVSTIEVRKNHLLLFRIWRRLLEEKPADQVPALVFAGRVGWLVDDLMRQIANTGNLNGKLVLIENPSDAELAALYEGCLFTLFPSFLEGWGLPVTESLALGKPCITSNTSALPEAGGKLTRRFDPDHFNEAYAMVRAALDDRLGLARWEAQIRCDFKPVPWSETAEAILARLGIERPPAVGLEGELQREVVK